MVLYSEIFKEFEMANNRQERIGILQKYGNHQFKEFLNYAFNPDIKFDISEIPQYKPSVLPAGLNDTYLALEKRLYLFLPVHKKYEKKLKKEREQAILGSILASLHKDEAKLLEQVMTKSLKIKNLTPKLVKEAFPEMPF